MTASTTGVTPFLMFEGSAEEAMNFYVSLFPDGAVEQVERYGPDGPGREGTVSRAVFTLAGQRFRCFDSFVQHAFTFTPAISLFVECADEAEIDERYARLLEGGTALMPLGEYDFSRKFGWVQDRFGVSWQLTLPH